MGDITWLADLGPTGLLALSVGLMFLGWLVPRSTLRREQERTDRAEASAKLALETIADLTSQVRRLAEVIEHAMSQGTGRHHSGDG